MNLGGTLVKPVQILMALCLLGLLSFVLVTHGVTEPPLQGLRNSGDTLPPWLNPFQLPRLGPGKIMARLLVERQTAGRLGDAKELGMAKGRERETLVPKALGRTCPLPSPQAKTLHVVLKARKPP